MQKITILNNLNSQISSCRKCDLCQTRKRTVPGEGNPDANLMFIGEAPGASENNTGQPFVGRAGKLLTKMINAMNLDRNDVFITNILKCRPPNNRDPKQIEIEMCWPYLFDQIKLIKPKIICTLGGPASKTILQTKESISRLRGKFYRFPPLQEILVMPTFHPAYLVRTPREKPKAWEDLQKIMRKLHERKTIPETH